MRLQGRVQTERLYFDNCLDLNLSRFHIYATFRPFDKLRDRNKTGR